jgi:hypothetical protein
MTPQPQSFTPPPVGLPAPARPSRLLAGIYHDIGMAAVAFCLDLDLTVESLEPSVHESVKRGSRYIYLMPRRQSAE